MSQRHILLRTLAIALLLGCSVPAMAKPVTINDITLDVPPSFTASDYERGIETKTSDEEVFVWFETYTGNESDALVAEHEKYWKEQNVVTGKPVKTTGKIGGNDYTKLDFEKATWKGEPTVLRYFEIGPVGPHSEFVLVTLWASPEGDTARANDVATMFNSLSVKIKQ